MTDCIFCKIAQKEIPADLLYDGKHVVAFRDRAPQAPVHVLVIPKKHIATLNDFQASDGDVLLEMVSTLQKLAQELGVAEAGYRTAINCNKEGGQTVFHLHAHLLGGRQLGGSMVG